VDRVSVELRSRIMRAVRARDTRPEMALRRALYARGLRGYRVAPKWLTGKPDVVFPGARLAIFVDGCFWHGCPDHCRMPAARASYWRTKIRRNRVRDASDAAVLRGQGWQVLRFWEHEIHDNAEAVVAAIAGHL